MPGAAVTRILRGFRPLPILVGVVVLLCGAAIFAALFLTPPHPGFPLPFDGSATPPAPRVVPRAAVAQPTPAQPPAVVAPSPPPPEAPTDEGFDWRGLPIKPQADALGHLRPVGALAIGRALPRVRRCMQSWQGTEAPRLDLALGVYASAAGSYVVENVVVTGGTVHDSSLEACVVAALEGVRFSVPDAVEGTRLRISENVTLPLPAQARRTEVEE
jgi:hypothetical protein